MPQNPPVFQFPVPQSPYDDPARRRMQPFQAAKHDVTTLPIRGLNSLFRTLDTADQGIRNVTSGKPMGTFGAGGSASGSPYDTARARQATGALSQIGDDIELPIGGDISRNNPNMLNRADALTRPQFQAQSSPTAAPQTPQAPQAPSRFASPRVQPGAESPTEALQTFQGGTQPYSAPVAPSLAEMFRLSNRPPEQTAYGANEFWANRLQEDLGAEEFETGLGQEEEKLRRAATMGGFQTPQEAAAADRAMKMYEIEAPVRAQEAGGRADIERQRLAGESAQEVESMRQAGFENRYGAMQDLLQTGNLGGSVRSFNPQSGAMSFGADRPIGNTILDAVTNARRIFEQASQSKMPWMSGNVAEAKAALDAAVASAFSQHPAPAEIKQFAYDIADNPNYKGMPLQQILELEGEDALTPQEINYLQNLLLIARGE